MNRLVKALRRAVVGAGAALLLASCGGGDPVERFAPTRMLVFGDEISLISSDGRKYTVNSLQADNTTLDCSNSTLWIQRLAGGYGLTLPQCNPNAVVDPPSRIYAAAGAKTADLAAQIDAHLAADTFGGKDLVTVMVGLHDVLEQYALYDGTNAATLKNELRNRGLVVAAQVGRIAEIGGKVLVSTPIDVGYTAFAAAQNTATNDTTRSSLLHDMTESFVEGLRAGLFNESGNTVALMLSNELIQTMAKFPSSYGIGNVTGEVCDATLAPTVDACTTQTLVTGGTTSNYLWAKSYYPSPQAHAYLGSLASSRVSTNPF